MFRFILGFTAFERPSFQVYCGYDRYGSGKVEFSRCFLFTHFCKMTWRGWAARGVAMLRISLKDTQKGGPFGFSNLNSPKHQTISSFVKLISFFPQPNKNTPPQNQTVSPFFLNPRAPTKNRHKKCTLDTPRPK